MNLKIGTRGSKLALTQTNFVAEKLKKAIPDANIEICIIKTSGDIMEYSSRKSKKPCFAIRLTSLCTA